MSIKKQKIYESPSVTADTVIFTIDENKLKVLLIKRANQPFKNWWALPGVFLFKNESVGRAALRALKEKTGVKIAYLEQLYTFDSPTRDPRGHVISTTYFALCPSAKLPKSALFSVSNLPKLAFDHKKIINYAVSRLRAKLEYTNVAYSLLPKYFTLSQLQEVYETVIGKKQDKRNFRKKFLSLGLIRQTRKKIFGARQRPAKLYEFISRRHAVLKKFF